MEPSLFSTLMTLPLFQGMSIDSLTEIVTKTPLLFKKIVEGNTIVEQENHCDSLIFLLKGKIKILAKSSTNAIKIEEIATAPAILQAESLFGLRTRYTHSFIAKTNVQLLIIGKQAITKQLLDYDIFRFNLLNMLCTKIQTSNVLLWNKPSKHPEKNFVHFLKSHCVYPAGEKRIYSKMTALASELGETRLTVSQMLHFLEKNKLVEIKRGSIVIPSLETLIAKNI